MKVAVSVPDPVFAEADHAAKRLGLSRSELYSRAIATYVAKLRAEDVTEALDRVYAREATERDPALVKLQRRMLARERW
jgi:metal-responsive CopG/Arc/MetJ family transcriptional regulator